MLKNKLQNTTKIIMSQLIISLKDCDKIKFMDNGSISCIWYTTYLKTTKYIKILRDSKIIFGYDEPQSIYI